MTIIENKSKIDVFTDGGCSPNPGKGSWAAIVIENNKIIKEFGGTESYTTNNRMEMKAIIEALKWSINDENITIHSDSKLCIKTLNEWAIRWEQYGWQRHEAGGEVKNLDLVKEAFELKKLKNKVNLIWIKGHNYHKWNDYVDSKVRSLLNNKCIIF